MSPGECVSPSSQKKRFIVGVFSVGAVASLGCVYSVSHRRIMLERVEEDDSAAVAETETVVRGRMELLMGWGRWRERERLPSGGGEGLSPEGAARSSP